MHVTKVPDVGCAKGTCVSGNDGGYIQVEDHGLQENAIRSYAAIMTR